MNCDLSSLTDHQKDPRQYFTKSQTAGLQPLYSGLRLKKASCEPEILKLQDEELLWRITETLPGVKFLHREFINTF